MLVCHCGDARHGTDLLAPLRALAPSDDRIGVASYLATQATIDPYTAGAHFQTNLFLPTLTSDAITTINAAATAAPPAPACSSCHSTVRFRASLRVNGISAAEPWLRAGHHGALE